MDDTLPVAAANGSRLLLLLSRLSRAEMVMEAVDLSALAKSVVAELRQED